MQTMDEEPLETIHLYVVREKELRPSLFPIFLSVFALLLLIVVCVLSPYQQPVTRISLRVPAVPSYVRSYSAPINVTPTGIRTYPATFAHGMLTITNGSIISQTLPAGFTSISSNGVSVVTDIAVFVPAGNANGFGEATVPAHLLASGLNLPTLAINQVVGTSLYVRNLQPFTGGHQAYSVKFVTSQDRHIALVYARQVISQEAIGLHYPCSETITNVLTWRCQFVSYSVPSYMRVTAAHLVGKQFIVDVVFVARPEHFWVK